MNAPKLIRAAGLFYFASRYYRGKGGWGWTWTNRRARLTMATTMLTMGVGTVLDVLTAPKPQPISPEHLENIKRIVAQLRERMDEQIAAGLDPFGPIDMDALRRNT